MRVSPTDSEAAIWQLLSGSNLGVAFKRQVVIGRYIVDLCAPSIKLIVEVDGGYHRERAKADARRQRELEALGYTVVRVRVP
jgi:very-short-patch-repair endonuclease